MKVHENLNKIAEQVNAGKLAPQEGLDRILEDMLNYPWFYGIQNLDEELRSDLVLRLLERGPGFFSRYKSDSGQFVTYFSTLVRYQVRDAMRCRHLKEINEKNVSELSRIEYENSLSKYNSQEYSYRLSNFKPYFPGRQDKAPFRPKHVILQEERTEQKKTAAENAGQYSKAREIFPATKKNILNINGKYCKKNLFEKTTLVLALKSCYYLTDDHIEGVSTLCGIPKEKLIEIVEELKESVSKREEKIMRAQKARDRSFQLRLKIEEELEDLPENARKEELLKNLQLHTKNWNSRNSMLKTQSYHPSPTNRKIAEVLGLCERQIGYYLQKAGETVEKHNKEMKLSEE